MPKSPLTEFQPVRFGYVAYPVWRRAMPSWLKKTFSRWVARYAPVEVDLQPPLDASDVAQYLVDWGIMQRVSPQTLTRDLNHSQAHIHPVDLSQRPTPYVGGKIRVPAQWEPIERVLISWAVIYPPVWAMHAQMTEAISQVADVDIVVPNDWWAHAVWTFLAWRGRANLARLRFTVLPTNDMWIRDYGPISGLDSAGNSVFVDAIYDVLPNYPQQLDNAFNAHYASFCGVPWQVFPLHFEGGNLWSDGHGTFLVSEQIYRANPYHNHETLLRVFQHTFDVQKLIITPRLRLEETGHIDLMVKLVDEQTVFVSSPAVMAGDALYRTQRQLERETNALGQRYQVVVLPTPELYLNWGVYPIRRHYTNALTVNGQVLVPICNTDLDEVALRLYEQHMPNYTIVPIDSSVGANGGGAVHCMTREIYQPSATK